MITGLETYTKSPPLPSLRSSLFSPWLFQAYSSMIKKTIFWKWSADKKFSVASAYKCQFYGSMVSFPASNIWTSYTEHKCNFFAWLVLHNRVLTVENMLKKNWPYNQTCSLCFCLQETTQHMLADCNYYEAVWDLIAPHLNLPSYSVLQNEGGPVQWFNTILSTRQEKEKKGRNQGCCLLCGG
jgi:hypothetical protein